jgi:hypothetical protein
MSMAENRVTDDARYANAQAASHGYGTGQLRASRLSAGWSQQDSHRLAVEVLENLDRAQWYAEQESPPFEEYLEGLRQDRDLAATLSDERLDTLRTVYLTGFDIGFRSALVEACRRVRQSAPAGS